MSHCIEVQSLVAIIHFSPFIHGFILQWKRRIHTITLMFTIHNLNSQANGSLITPITMCISPVSNRWCLETWQGSVSRQGSRDIVYPLESSAGHGWPPQRALKQCPANDVQRILWGLVSRHGLLDTVKKHMESHSHLEGPTRKPRHASVFSTHSDTQVPPPRKPIKKLI